MVYDPVARLIVVYCEHGNDRILMVRRARELLVFVKSLILLSYSGPE